MCINDLRTHTLIDVHRQYEVFGIVYDRCTPHRTSRSAIQGKTERGSNVIYEIGETYSALEEIIETDNHQMYRTGFHRFACLEDAREYICFVADIENFEPVIAKFTVSGKDAMTQGYVREGLPVIVWRKVTYAGCVLVRSGTYRFLYTYTPIPDSEHLSTRPLELVEAAKGSKDYAFANELEYLGEEIIDEPR